MTPSNPVTLIHKNQYPRHRNPSIQLYIPLPLRMLRTPHPPTPTGKLSPHRPFPPCPQKGSSHPKAPLNAMSESESYSEVDQQIPPQENVQHKVAHKRMQETKAQIDEVTGILKKNVDLILQRDEKLSELDDRADALKDEASEFGKQTGKIKRKYWWKNCKMLAILMGICLVAIIIILVWAISVEP